MDRIENTEIEDYEVIEKGEVHWRESVRGAMGSRRGMSLVEIMVVIAIILTLMSVLAYGVMGVFESSRVDTTQLTMGKASSVVNIYMLRHGKPPSTSEGLNAAYDTQPVPPPKDAWDNELRYTSPGPNGTPFDIISYGADGSQGGTGLNADIKMSDNQR